MADEHVKIELNADGSQFESEVKKAQRRIEAFRRSLQSLNDSMKKMTAGLNGGGSTGDNFSKSQDAAMRGLRQRFTFETRMNRQRASEERAISSEQARQDRARKTVEDRAMRDFNTRMAIQRRTLREQAGMERDAERARASAMRETFRLDNWRFNLRQRHEREIARDRARADRETARDARASDRRRADVRRSVSRGFSDGRDLSGRVVDAARSITVLGAVGTGVLTKLGSIGLEARSRIDTAEANLRMFGGQSRDQVNATRSGWLNRSAVEYGFRPDKALNAFTEVLKAGIPEIAAKDVTRSIMGASAGLDLDVPDTTKLVGRLATLTQDPKKFDAGAIDKMLNGLAVVAKVTAADSKELVSSLRRGAGVLGSSKMSVQDLTAFTGVGISAGMQEGKAGTFMDFLVNDMVNAKTARGQRGKDLSEGFRLLSLGSNASVSRQTAQDPTAILLKMFEKMAKMDPQRAARAANLIGMREWRGEMLMMAKASPMLRQTVEAERDPKNAGHLKQASDERLGTLAGLRSQLVATFDLAWEAVGGGIEDIVREIGTFFVNLGKFTDFDVIKAHVHTLIDGFVDGLGFKNITEMLEAAFGKPGDMNYGTLKSFFEFAQGFGRGVREVIDTVKSVVSAFTGSKIDPDALGDLTAKILGFSLALVTIAPYVAVLGGLATALGGFAVTIATIATTLRAAGLLGGAASAAGAPGAGAAAGGILGRLLGALKLAPAVAMPLTLDPSKADKDKLMGRLGRWAQEREQTGGTGTWQDPPARVQPQSLDVETTGSIAALVKKASYTGYDDRDDETRRVANGVEDLRSLLQKAALTNGGIGASVAASVGGGSGGGSGGSGGGGSSRFFTPPDMKVPDWFGKGRGAPGGDTASPDQKSGGSRSWRNNNPGNIEYGPFARSMGATGTDGRFAKFPSYEAGRKAQEKLLFDSKGYRDLTLSGAIRRWAPASENNVPAYLRAMGGDPGKRMSEYTSDQRAKLLDAMQAHEGWRAGTVAGGGKVAGLGTLGIPDTGLTTDGPIRANLMHGQFGAPGENLTGIRSKSGRSAQVNKASAPSFQGFIDEMESLGYKIKDLGGFNNRDIRGVSGRKSQHAYGNAIDLNPGKNPLGTSMTDMPEQTRAIAKKYGLIWGMDWKGRKDPMHFEWNGTRPWLEQQKAVASLKSVGDKARAAESVKLSPGEKVDVGGGMKGVPFGPRTPAATVDAAVNSVPPGIGRGGGGGAGGGGKGGNVYHVTNTIHGAGERPEEIANKVQRTLTADWNHRAHDLEPELV